MRGIEICAANAVALVVGLLGFYLFRPQPEWPLVGLFLAGMGTVAFFRRRGHRPGATQHGPGMGRAELLLNGLFGSFFALLAYYVLLALVGAIGYPHR